MTDLTCSSGYYLVRTSGATNGKVTISGTTYIIPNKYTCAACSGLTVATCAPTPTMSQCATGYYLSLSSGSYTCVTCG